MLEARRRPRPWASATWRRAAANAGSARKYRINGTPGIVFEDGKRSAGAMNTEQIEKQLLANRRCQVTPAAHLPPPQALPPPRLRRLAALRGGRLVHLAGAPRALPFVTAALSAYAAVIVALSASTGVSRCARQRV